MRRGQEADIQGFKGSSVQKGPPLKSITSTQSNTLSKGSEIAKLRS